MNTHAKSVSLFYKLIPSGTRELGEGTPFELGESRFIHQIYIYINTLKSAQKRRAAKGESASLQEALFGRTDFAAFLADFVLLAIVADIRV